MSEFESGAVAFKADDGLDEGELKRSSSVDSNLGWNELCTKAPVQYCDEDEEVFFGPPTAKELRRAARLADRVTLSFDSNFRDQESFMDFRSISSLDENDNEEAKPNTEDNELKSIETTVMNKKYSVSQNYDLDAVSVKSEDLAKTPPMNERESTEVVSWKKLVKVETDFSSDFEPSESTENPENAGSRVAYSVDKDENEQWLDDDLALKRNSDDDLSSVSSEEFLRSEPTDKESSTFQYENSVDSTSSNGSEKTDAEVLKNILNVTLKSESEESDNDFLASDDAMESDSWETCGTDDSDIDENEDEENEDEENEDEENEDEENEDKEEENDDDTDKDDDENFTDTEEEEDDKENDSKLCDNPSPEDSDDGKNDEKGDDLSDDFQGTSEYDGHDLSKELADNSEKQNLADRSCFQKANGDILTLLNKLYINETASSDVSNSSGESVEQRRSFLIETDEKIQRNFETDSAVETNCRKTADLSDLRSRDKMKEVSPVPKFSSSDCDEMDAHPDTNPSQQLFNPVKTVNQVDGKASFTMDFSFHNLPSIPWESIPIRESAVNNSDAVEKFKLQNDANRLIKNDTPSPVVKSCIDLHGVPDKVVPTQKSSKTRLESDSIAEDSMVMRNEEVVVDVSADLGPTYLSEIHAELEEIRGDSIMPSESVLDQTGVSLSLSRLDSLVELYGSPTAILEKIERETGISAASSLEEDMEELHKLQKEKRILQQILKEKKILQEKSVEEERRKLLPAASGRLAETKMLRKRKPAILKAIDMNKYPRLAYGARQLAKTGKKTANEDHLSILTKENTKANSLPKVPIRFRSPAQPLVERHNTIATPQQRRVKWTDSESCELKSPHLDQEPTRSILVKKPRELKRLPASSPDLANLSPVDVHAPRKTKTLGRASLEQRYAKRLKQYEREVSTVPNNISKK